MGFSYVTLCNNETGLNWEHSMTKCSRRCWFCWFSKQHNISPYTKVFVRQLCKIQKHCLLPRPLFSFSLWLYKG